MLRPSPGADLPGGQSSKGYAKPDGRHEPAICQRVPSRADVLLRGAVITLYSYPELFGVADNNGYGLKVFAFMRLAGVAFRHEHIFDASAAPRGQLPYVVDDGETIGDSETIIAHLIRKYSLT